MNLTFSQAESAISERLSELGVMEPGAIAWATVWLEACGYKGIGLLNEALADSERALPLQRDVLGFDLQSVSAAFLAPAIMRDVEANGRVFLRNVRHGLFLLPFTVRSNIAIGCPVDPAFAVGGERSKNPYEEKLALADAQGIDIDDRQWALLLGPHGG